MSIKYKLSALLLFAAVGSKAQQQVKSAPRLYFTACWGSNVYEVFYNGRADLNPSGVIFSPWKPSVGIFITPRLSLETSWLRYRDTYREGAYGRTAAGATISLDVYEKVRAWGVPITARYALTRTGRRLRVEALAGVSYVAKSFQNERRRMEGDKVIEYSYLEGQGANLHAMVGLSGRFKIIQHLELVADYCLNHVLRNVSGDVHTALIGNPTGLTRNRSIGLRYSFNPRIPKARAKADPPPQ